MHIIVYTFPFRGHSMQAISIANYLADKGHTVTVDAAQAFFQYISPKIKKQECLYGFLKFLDKNKKDNLLNCAEGVLVTTQRYIRNFRVKADLIIFDSMAYWGKYIAEKQKIPSVSLFTIQPFTKELFNNYAFDYLKNYTCEFDSQKEFFRYLHIYQIVAKKKFEMLDDFTFDEFMCARGNTNIVLLPKAICKFSNDLGSSYRVFSPMIDRKDEIVKKNKSIYIATGSIISNMNLLISCIDVLLPYEREIHISSGKYTYQLKYTYAKYVNIHFYEFAPQIELLKQASIFITHGGSNSVCEAIAARTPMIVIPLVNDEFLNAEMIVERGIGLQIDNDSIAIKSTLGRLCEKIWDDVTYIDRINEIAKEIDCKRVLETIDEIVKDNNNG